MHKHPVTVPAVLVVFATITLSACGPDDRASANVDQSSAASGAPTPSAQETTQTVTPSVAFGASAALSTMQSGAPDASSDSAVQSVQASLAADSRQVAPVMHDAPGDGGNTNSTN
ncbi:hypothetical protein [Paraburkholderia sp.]|jgi:hypothetical protein|uniref:hypothetical protein n=1 Tax=Paraburkholderia sp. TaxID=1926495 RepID=UPI002F3F0AED